MANLYVIAGHGAGDPGAQGNGYSEADQVRKLAQRIVALGGGQVDHYPYDQNCYADNGLARISPGCPIIECHMDSGGYSARGGHVIIRGEADEYDRNLAGLMAQIFPGRSNLIVDRTDLQNPNVASGRGLNYRLVEFGFISNAEDANKFETRLDEIARGVLSAFGISAGGGEPSNPQNPGQPVNNAGFTYRAHVQDFGWLDPVRDGQVAGTTGKAKRLECIKITPPAGLDLTVKVHIQNVGWKSFKVVRGSADPEIGSVGKAQRIEALEVGIDRNETGKRLYYQVHVAGHGWTGWVEAGYATGTVGIAKAIEAVQFKLV